MATSTMKSEKLQHTVNLIMDRTQANNSEQPVPNLSFEKCRASGKGTDDHE
jgi:hypothetical protein